MTADKRLSMVRQAIAAVITLCQVLHLPLAHENLDSSKRKRQNNGKRHDELLHRKPTAILAQVIASACLARRSRTVAGEPGLHLRDRQEIDRIWIFRSSWRSGGNRPACHRIQSHKEG
jgi:hypothetical protein